MKIHQLIMIVSQKVIPKIKNIFLIMNLVHTFTEVLLLGDAKATFNQAALDIGICTVDNFNKVLPEMTKHALPACSFPEQKTYLHRHLVNPKNMKLCSFIGRPQKLNAYIEEFPPDIER